MTYGLTWLATFATVALLVCYEVALAVAGRRAPGRLARTAHASLRRGFEAVSVQKGLRNPGGADAAQRADVGDDDGVHRSTRPDRYSDAGGTLPALELR